MRERMYNSNYHMSRSALHNYLEFLSISKVYPMLLFIGH